MVAAVPERRVLERFDDGRPHKVVMKVKTVGITDEQTIESPGPTPGSAGP